MTPRTGDDAGLHKAVVAAMLAIYDYERLIPWTEFAKAAIGAIEEAGWLRTFGERQLALMHEQASRIKINTIQDLKECSQKYFPALKFSHSTISLDEKNEPMVDSWVSLLWEGEDFRKEYTVLLRFLPTDSLILLEYVGKAWFRKTKQ